MTISYYFSEQNKETKKKILEDVFFDEECGLSSLFLYNVLDLIWIGAEHVRLGLNDDFLFTFEPYFPEPKTYTKTYILTWIFLKM